MNGSREQHFLYSPIGLPQLDSFIAPINSSQRGQRHEFGAANVLSVVLQVHDGSYIFLLLLLRGTCEFENLPFETELTKLEAEGLQESLVYVFSILLLQGKATSRPALQPLHFFT